MALSTRSVLASTRTWRCSSCRNAIISQRRSISIQELDQQRDGRERIVVLGSGWAGFTLSRELDPRKFQPVVVSPRSYFVFTPLLASTSTGTLEFRTALEPIRSRRAKAQFFQGWADAVDLEKKTLSIEEAVEDPMQQSDMTSAKTKDAPKKKGKMFSMSYDKLTISVGCYSQTFGTPGVKEHAYFLKDISDARKIRNRLLSLFETAALPTTSLETKKQLLNLAVVGGGPTGIEWSAEFHDLIAEDMAKLYPDLAKLAKITVYDVAPTVLSMFDEKLARYAMKTFKRQGIEILTSHKVKSLRPGPPGEKSARQSDDGPPTTTPYTLDTQEDGEVAVGMCVWSTGLAVNPFIEKALAGHVRQHDRSHGILTNDRLRVKRSDDSIMSEVYALGDCAVLEGSSYPATAQVANQKARWLAKRLNKGDIEAKGFTYKDLGVMAYVGNWNAIVQTNGTGDISGRLAWLIWRGAYLAKSVSWRNRILIPTYWFCNWLFGRDVSRF
ncbi:hypothetical protein LTR15_007263 [Elasticomyces elasticus]|nr:hypothetical protein LTR15_007263 [Elasticomyces elasticus]